MRRHGNDPEHTTLVGRVDDLARLAERARRFHPRVYDGGVRTEQWHADSSGTSVWARLGDRSSAIPRLVASIAGPEPWAPGGDLAAGEHIGAWGPGPAGLWTSALRQLLIRHHPVQQLAVGELVCKYDSEHWPCTEAAPWIDALTGRAPLVALVRT